MVERGAGIWRYFAFSALRDERDAGAAGYGQRDKSTRFCLCSRARSGALYVALLFCAASRWIITDLWPMCAAAALAVLASDSKYRKYTQQVDKCLNTLESVQEWADFIAFLTKLLKVRSERRVVSVSQAHHAPLDISSQYSVQGSSAKAHRSKAVGSVPEPGSASRRAPARAGRLCLHPRYPGCECI